MLLLFSSSVLIFFLLPLRRMLVVHVVAHIFNVKNIVASNGGYSRVSADQVRVLNCAIRTVCGGQWLMIFES